MNILITGTSRGIGKELVNLFAKNTNNTIVVFTSQKNIVPHQKNVKAYTINFLGNNFDKQIENTFKLINLKFDVVINNAGLLINKPFISSTLNDLQQLNTVNFYAPYLICQQIAKNYAATNCHIVNIGSMGGVQGSVKFPGLSVYSATKAALANLTECLAEELKETNIKVNCLALGSVQTEMLKQAFSDYTSPVKVEDMATYIYEFSVTANKLFNGKIIPVAVTTP